MNKIEIDITYQCNLRCASCNRSCSQSPTTEFIHFYKMKELVDEWRKLGKKWELINVAGGEPTLHPDFLKIVELLLEYIIRHSPDTTLQITSNGTNEALEVLEKLPCHENLVIDEYSFKKNIKNNIVQHFIPFNDAPMDHKNFAKADYSKGCWVTAYCGIGLTPRGYYACTIAGAIDRIVGIETGIPSLGQVSTETLVEHLRLFCRYCGNFFFYDKSYGNFLPLAERPPLRVSIMSETWEKLYKEYNSRKNTK